MISQKTFAQVVNFSRSTVGRYFNAAGLLVQAAINEPRFEYDAATLQPKGLLLEPQRQNALTFSQDFSNAAWVKSRATATLSGVAPDGTSTAWSVAGTGAAGDSYLFRSAQSWVNATQYAFTVFAKAGTGTILSLRLPSDGFGSNILVNFDLTGNGSFVVVVGTATTVAQIVKLANGYFRCCLMATSTGVGGGNWIAISVGNTTTNAFTLWGAQLEVGSWHSSYIPTTNTAATRNADSAYIDLNEWFKSGEGTLYTEVAQNGGQSFHASLGTTATSGPRIANWKSSTGSVNSQVVANDLSTSFAATVGSVTPGQILKQALAYRTDDFQCAANGTLSAVDTSGAVPTPARLTLGARGVSGDILNGHVRKIKYYPYRLTADQLRAATL